MLEPKNTPQNAPVLEDSRQSQLTLKNFVTFFSFLDLNFHIICSVTLWLMKRGTISCFTSNSRGKCLKALRGEHLLNGNETIIGILVLFLGGGVNLKKKITLKKI